MLPPADCVRFRLSPCRQDPVSGRLGFRLPGSGPGLGRWRELNPPRKRRTLPQDRALTARPPIARERPPLRLCPKRRPPPRPVADRGRHDDFGCGPSGAAAPLSPRPPSRSCVTFRFLFRFFFLVLRAVAVELRGGGSSLFGRTVVLSGGTFVINSRKAW